MKCRHVTRLLSTVSSLLSCGVPHPAGPYRGSELMEFTKVWKPGAYPTPIYEKGTKVRFIEPLLVSVKTAWSTEEYCVPRGTFGVIKRVFPNVIISIKPYKNELYLDAYVPRGTILVETLEVVHEGVDLHVVD